MTVLSEIHQRLALPATFGETAPFARFSRVQDDRSAGEDITVEYQAEQAGAAVAIVFSHTEWQETAGRLTTRPLCTAVIDVLTGEPRGSSPEEVAELAEQVRAALIHADQMERVEQGLG